MIITRTPFRISFCGGGSDISQYYREYGGCVLSSTIDKYIFLSIHPYFQDGYLLKYSENEHIMNVNDIKHNIIREVFKKYNVCNVDFNSSADIPSGTGMGSSSAFTCGLINLCNFYLSKFKSNEDIAKEACKIEIDILKHPIGKQDQYSCGIGGLNFIEFKRDDNVIVSKLAMDSLKKQELSDNLLLFYTGTSRDANVILEKQVTNLKSSSHKNQLMHKIVKLTYQLKQELLNNNIDSMGSILHENWMYKKELANTISSQFIDDNYELAKKNGAIGGKILGAGGGGFFLFYSKKENHEKLRKSLSHMKELEFSLESSGTNVIYSN